MALVLGMIFQVKNQMMILAAMAPMNVDEGDGPIPWAEYVQREVGELLEWYREATRTAMLARIVVYEPDECEDELEAG